MLAQMRTTLNVTDYLMIGVKELAARRRCTITVIIEEALAEKLARANERTDLRVAEPLPVYTVERGNEGFVAGVALDDLLHELA
jgi:hypothetical protein